jgi:hypothetical protein
MPIAITAARSIKVGEPGHVQGNAPEGNYSAVFEDDGESALPEQRNPPERHKGACSVKSNLDEESIRVLEDAAQRLATVRPDPPRRRSVMGHVFVWLGLIAQGISIAVLVAMHWMSPRENYYTGLLVLGFTLWAGVVIVPGTLFALVRAISDAVQLLRKDEPAPRWFIFYGVATLMPLGLCGVVIWADS